MRERYCINCKQLFDAKGDHDWLCTRCARDDVVSVRNSRGHAGYCRHCGAIVDLGVPLCDTCDEAEYRRRRDAAAMSNQFQRRLI